MGNFGPMGGGSGGFNPQAPGKSVPEADSAKERREQPPID